MIVRIKTKSFNQIWITDLKAHEVSSKALKEDEIIKYSNLIPLSNFPITSSKGLYVVRETMEK